MKRSLVFQKKNFYSNPLKSKRTNARLTRKFWFFTKYFYCGPFIKNMFLGVKKHYFYYFNFFKFFFFINWVKFFSLKYYSVYLENLNTFFLKYKPLLPKFEKHLGELHKPFFIDKNILYHLPYYY